MANVFLCRCHDEENQGARAPNSLTEWQIAEQINVEAKSYLWLNNCSAMILEKTLAERITGLNAFAETAKHLTIAIETHCNRYVDPDREGFFVMAHLVSGQGRKLATAIQHELEKTRPEATSRGINLVDKDRMWIHTSREFPSPKKAFICDTVCPAVLIETVYLTNEKEADWITNMDNRSKIGRAIGRGILRFLEVEEYEQIS